MQVEMGKRYRVNGTLGTVAWDFKNGSTDQYLVVTDDGRVYRYGASQFSEIPTRLHVVKYTEDPQGSWAIGTDGTPYRAQQGGNARYFTRTESFTDSPPRIYTQAEMDAVREACAIIAEHEAKGWHGDAALSACAHIIEAIRNAK